MAGGEERVALLQPRADGMAAPHRQRIAVGVELLPVKPLEGVADRDDEVDGAGELGGEDRRPPPRHHVDGDVRRRLRDLLHQRRHQQFDREIRHHQPKMPLAAARRRNHPATNSPRTWSSACASGPRSAWARGVSSMRAPVAHQQGIAQQVAQPLQRMACRRLRQPDPHRRAADAGFLQQRVERDQQIEVKRIQIHGVNIYHTHYRLEECRTRAP